MRVYYENPDWYRAQYNLAATWANWATKVGPVSVEEWRLIVSDTEGILGEPPPVEQAKIAAVELLEGSQKARRTGRRLLSRLRRWLGRRDKTEDEALQAFLVDTIEPTTLILWVGMELLQANDRKRQEQLTSREPLGNRRQLIRSVVRGERVDPLDIVASISAEKGPNPSVHYNLACLKAELGDESSALSHLEAAIERTPPQARAMLAARMRSDPTLKVLGPKLDRTLERRFGIEPPEKDIFEESADFLETMRPLGPSGPERTT